MNPAPSLERLLAREDLSAAEMEGLMEAMLTGALGPAAIAGLLVALRAKGETVEELAAAARVMRRHARGVPAPPGRPLLDTCGTGGDGTGTFNLSTAAALVAASGGALVAKHGNRSVSSKAGSADVLEALGLRLDLPPERLGQLLASVGVAFLFAPAHHAATRHAVGPRRDLGVRTLFNLLGPLTNPAGAQRQVVGVFAEAWVRPLAEVLQRLGSERAMVVHGAGGLDELSLAGESLIAELREGEVHTWRLRPGDLGLAEAPVAALRGGDAVENARILRAIFAGERGPRADAVALNAAAALVVAGRVPDLHEGLDLARTLLAEGHTAALLDRLIAESHR